VGKYAPSAYRQEIKKIVGAIRVRVHEKAG